ncbi:MAG TPA: ATP-binding protein, partial [Nitrospiria bacterium]|nr:ATP-binding protein [Nitrospiria bacterium]
LELLHEHPEIALVVSDQRMPGMSGVELLQRAMQIVPDAVRMLITAYTDMDVVIEAINTGNVYRYVSKPYNEADLRFSVMLGIERYYLIRERDRLYSEKIETLKRVSRTNRLTAIGILAAGMAHEINNPLVAISTFLQMLPEKLKEPKRDEEYWGQFYNVSVKETERIRTLIGQLLNYSKTAGKEDLELTDIDVNDLITEVVALLNNEAKKKEIEFEVKLETSLPHGKADKEKIRQVLLNLVLNSIHATDRGKITLSTNVSQDELRRAYLKVTVADTGAGISEEDLHNLFNPFFTTKKAEGTGLGLMTCHHIIEEHRGNIDVRSELGKGTTVILQIPVDPLKHERRKADRRVDV